MRLGLGLQLTRLGCGSLSGSGVPADALGNLGDRYFDTTAGRWYLKRWVGNLLSDVVYVPAIGPIDGLVGDWTCELVYRGIGFISATNELGIFRHNYSSGVSHSRLQKTNGNSFLTLTLRDSAGVMAFQTSVTNANVLGSLFHKVKFGISRSTAFLKVDEFATSDVSCVGWAPLQAVKTSMTDTDGSPGDYAIQMVSCKLSNPNGVVYDLPYDDGSGSLVRDISGNGNNGTITDNSPTTFWEQTWVPMDLM